VVTAPARRVLVRSMTERGLSERRALSGDRHECGIAALRAGARSECDVRARILAVAHRHRRYGAA